MNLTLPLIALNVAILASSAQAQLLFSDNFDQVNGFVNEQLNVGINYAGRQSGSLGVLSYAQDFGFAGYADPAYTGDNFNYFNISQQYVGYQGTLSGSNSPNHNFIDSGRLQISFNMFVQNQGTGQTGIGFFNFGSADQTNLGTIKSFDSRYLLSGLSLAVTTLTGLNSLLSFYDGTSLITSVAFTTLNTYPTGDAFVLNIETPDAYDGSGTATISLTINGQTIDLNGAGVGTDYTRAGLTSNYINFGGAPGDLAYDANTTIAFDNLSISAVPEPGTVSLLLGGGLVFSMLRARRRLA